MHNADGAVIVRNDGLRNFMDMDDGESGVNSLVVNRSGASLKKTGVPVLLNALSYARQAHLRPPRLSKQLWTMAAALTGGSGGHGPPPSLARTSLASEGPWSPSVLRV